MLRRVFLIFFLASVSSNSSEFWTLNNGNYFIPVCCFIFFNLGDYIGRFVAEYIQWPKPGKIGMIIVFILSILRVGFIPLFLHCNIARGGPESLPTGTFKSDWFYIIFMILFSLSNGYLSNICMMSAPQIVKDNERGTGKNYALKKYNQFDLNTLALKWNRLIYCH